MERTLNVTSRTDNVENYFNRELLLRYLGGKGFKDLEDIQDEQPLNEKWG